MNKTDKIFVAGGRGMVGGAIVRALKKAGYENVVAPSHKELDLTNQARTLEFFQDNRPDAVVVAAAKVGGIYANNTYPADFISVNLQIAVNTICAAHQLKTPRLLYLGSTCIYPKFAPQPIPESALLTGALEPTNEGYAVAKIAGLKLCEFYRKQYGDLFHSAMPTNLYGANDNYHEKNSHVLPALLRRFYEAKNRGDKEVAMWGSGEILREFLHVDDLASACVFLLELDNPPDLVNLGSGEEITIKRLAELVAQTVGFDGKIVHDLSKPDGTPRKLSDTSLLRKLGWKPKIDIQRGLKLTFESFKKELSDGTIRM